MFEYVVIEEARPGALVGDDVLEHDDRQDGRSDVVHDALGLQRRGDALGDGDDVHDRRDDGRPGRDQQGADEQREVPWGAQHVPDGGGGAEERPQGADRDQPDGLTGRLPEPLEVQVEGALEDDDGDAEADDGR
jgi:hypothetical protein